MLLRRQFSAADIHLVIRCLRYGNKKSSTPQYNRWRHLAVLISSHAGGDINANEITVVVHRCIAEFCLYMVANDGRVCDATTCAGSSINLIGYLEVDTYNIDYSIGRKAYEERCFQVFFFH